MLGIAALVTAALFSGAAIYILAVEHPARAYLDARAQLTQWKPAYARGTVMQAGLAVISGLLGIAAGLIDGGILWIVGGVVMLSAIAYTFLVIWNLNGRLKATPLDQASPETIAMLHRWGQLHAGRTAIGVVAMLIYAVAQCGWS
ncbi:DUF1772 domain-containing protein [Sphingomonas sp. So64.6b]|uniref:DUF1772 domain-containing protein n=1 Tax=Sphingomonas sp. So64.6b TaxID=2997354 RepID=UPI0015FFA307|nr:DUF1772 domain-containing protein [Sphingomonas sp. So64.6b]QNA86500.1 DUF1772 domain-containing protein [Sphingomonas sp. So64.6b]